MIPNEDSLRDRYDRLCNFEPATVTCHFCHVGGWAPEEVVEFYAGHACTDCATECPHCGDWLGDGPEVVVDGLRWHKICAEESEEAAA